MLNYTTSPGSLPLRSIICQVNNMRECSKHTVKAPGLGRGDPVFYTSINKYAFVYLLEMNYKCSGFPILIAF